MKKILILPGMGDIYWVMVKLKSFLEQEGITEKPLIYTWEVQLHKKNRSADYIKRIPFVEYGDGWIPNGKPREFDHVYFRPNWLVRNFMEFDYLISMNGVLRVGSSLESNGLEKYTSDWYFSLSEDPMEETCIKEYKEKYGNFIMGYFTDDGMFSSGWLNSLPISSIYQFLSQIYDKTGYKTVLTGCHWDKAFVQKLMSLDTKSILVDGVGETSVSQLFSLIKASKGVIGWCGGSTIKSVYFKKPTLIIWSNYFKSPGFFKHSVPPDSFGNWHEMLVAEHTNPQEVASTMINLLQKNID